MHEWLALYEVMIHDIKLSSLLSYVSAGSQPNNFPCRTSIWIKVHVLIDKIGHEYGYLKRDIFWIAPLSCALCADIEVTPLSCTLLADITYFS
jgi:hypothetical protein